MGGGKERNFSESPTPRAATPVDAGVPESLGQRHGFPCLPEELLCSCHPLTPLALPGLALWLFSSLVLLSDFPGLKRETDVPLTHAESLPHPDGGGLLSALSCAVAGGVLQVLP